MGGGKGTPTNRRGLGRRLSYTRVSMNFSSESPAGGPGKHIPLRLLCSQF